MTHQTFLTQSAGPQNRYRDCLGISIRAGIFRIDITPLARSLIKGASSCTQTELVTRLRH
jgi:hypothetical protein